MKRRGALFLSFLLVLGIIGCAVQQPEEAATYQIFVLASQQSAAGADAIVGEAVELDIEEDAPLEEKAVAVVEAILSSGDYLWDGIELRGITVKGRRAYVDLNRRYASLTGIQLSLADYCITLSLTQLEGLSSVTITAEGQELAYRPSQVLMEQDVLLSTMDDVVETVTVSLYFVNESGELEAEQRTLEMYEGQTLAQCSIEALLEGPQERDLTSIIPEGFRVNSVRVEEGVCILSLPKSSVELLPADEAAQRLILQSFAKTIYRWGTVDEIQILVDGELCELFGSVPVAEVQFRPAEETGQE